MAYSLKDITEHLRHSLPTVNLQSYQKFIHNHLQITKATIETIAENTSDGVIAPMLYIAFGGVIACFIYKEVRLCHLFHQ